MKTLALLSLSLAVALALPVMPPGVEKSPVLTKENQLPLLGDLIPLQGHVEVENPAPQAILPSKDLKQNMAELEVKVKPDEEHEVKAEAEVEKAGVVELEVKVKPEVKVEEKSQEVKAEAEVPVEAEAQMMNAEAGVNPEGEGDQELKDDPEFQVESKVEPDQLLMALEPEEKHMLDEENYQEHTQLQADPGLKEEEEQEEKAEEEEEEESHNDMVDELEPLSHVKLFGDEMSKSELAEEEKAANEEFQSQDSLTEPEPEEEDKEEDKKEKEDEKEDMEEDKKEKEDKLEDMEEDKKEKEDEEEGEKEDKKEKEDEEEGEKEDKEENKEEDEKEEKEEKEENKEDDEKEEKEEDEEEDKEKDEEEDEDEDEDEEDEDEDENMKEENMKEDKKERKKEDMKEEKKEGKEENMKEDKKERKEENMKEDKKERKKEDMKEEKKERKEENMKEDKKERKEENMKEDKKERKEENMKEDKKEGKEEDKAKNEMVDELIVELKPLDYNSPAEPLPEEEELFRRKRDYVSDEEQVMELEPEMMEEPIHNPGILEEGPALDIMDQPASLTENYFPNEEAKMAVRPGEQESPLAGEEKSLVQLYGEPETEDQVEPDDGEPTGLVSQEENQDLTEATKQNRGRSSSCLKLCLSKRAMQGRRSCPGVVLGEKCYQFFKEPKTAANAELFCQEFPGGHLASITTNHNHGELMKMILKENGKYTRTWIGGLRFLDTGRFIWLDGSKWDYTDWLSGEPNNTATKENCLEVLPYGKGKFNDFTCWEPQAFICSYYN